MSRPALLLLVQQAQERQREIKLRQAQIEAEQRAIKADAVFYGRPIPNLAEYQAKRRQAILDIAAAERDELDAKFAANVTLVDAKTEQDWKRAQAARTDCR